MYALLDGAGIPPIGQTYQHLMRYHANLATAAGWVGRCCRARVHILPAAPTRTGFSPATSDSLKAGSAAYMPLRQTWRWPTHARVPLSIATCAAPCLSYETAHGSASQRLSGSLNACAFVLSLFMNMTQNLRTCAISVAHQSRNCGRAHTSLKRTHRSKLKLQLLTGPSGTSAAPFS